MYINNNNIDRYVSQEELEILMLHDLSVKLQKQSNLDYKYINNVYPDNIKYPKVLISNDNLRWYANYHIYMLNDNSIKNKYSIYGYNSNAINIYFVNSFNESINKELLSDNTYRIVYIHNFNGQYITYQFITTLSDIDTFIGFVIEELDTNSHVIIRVNPIIKSSVVRKLNIPSENYISRNQSYFDVVTGELVNDSLIFYHIDSLYSETESVKKHFSIIEREFVNGFYGSNYELKYFVNGERITEVLQYGYKCAGIVQDGDKFEAVYYIPDSIADFHTKEIKTTRHNNYYTKVILNSGNNIKKKNPNPIVVNGWKDVHSITPEENMGLGIDATMVTSAKNMYLPIDNNGTNNPEILTIVNTSNLVPQHKGCMYLDTAPLTFALNLDPLFYCASVRTIFCWDSLDTNIRIAMYINPDNTVLGCFTDRKGNSTVIISNKRLSPRYNNQIIWNFGSADGSDWSILINGRNYGHKLADNKATERNLKDDMGDIVMLATNKYYDNNYTTNTYIAPSSYILRNFGIYAHPIDEDVATYFYDNTNAQLPIKALLSYFNVTQEGVENGFFYNNVTGYFVNISNNLM